MSVTTQTKKRRPWARIIGLGIFAVIVLCVLVFKIAVTNFYMERTPEDAGFTRIINKYEKVFGLGPGGNETIVVFYKMRNAAAERLISNSDAYFADLPGGADRCRRYSDWTETPMPRVIEPRSSAYDTAQISPHQTINEYLNKYGFGIPLSRADEALINASLASPGSYYASGRCGLFLIVPEARRGIYIHVG